jgi:hypothetical protein
VPSDVISFGAGVFIYGQSDGNADDAYSGRNNSR